MWLGQQHRNPKPSQIQNVRARIELGGSSDDLREYQYLEPTLSPTGQANNTMVINPTYLAQRTRSCTNSIPFRTLGEKSCGLMIHSDELARCATEGIPCLSTMAEIGQSRKMNAARRSRS